MTEFIILMALLMSCIAISIDAMLPALGVIGQDLHAVSVNETQFIISSIFLGMTVGQLFWGPLSDAIGRRKVLFAGMGIYMIGSVICYLSNDLTTMLIGRTVQGLGVSGPYVSVVAIVRDRFAGRDMARVMSLVMMIFILVPAIAPSLGQFIMHIASWREIYLMYIVLAAVMSVWVYIRLPETIHAEDKIKFDIKNIMRGFKIVLANRVTCCYMLCMGICFGGLIGYLNSSRQIFQDMFQVGDAFALYFGGLALVIGVASLLNARIVHKYGMRLICHRATLTIIIASAIFMAVNLTMDVQIWMFVAYAAVLFFSFGVMFGNLNAIAMEPMGHIAGIASAVTGSTASLISMLVGSFIGQQFNGTLMPVVTGFLVLNVLSLGIMMLAERKPTLA
jgi:DHA1 family bicyclomycin/chloramphenicol resistance-like MFS transporter